MRMNEVMKTIVDPTAIVIRIVHSLNLSLYDLLHIIRIVSVLTDSE